MVKKDARGEPLPEDVSTVFNLAFGSVSEAWTGRDSFLFVTRLRKFLNLCDALRQRVCVRHHGRGCCHEQQMEPTAQQRPQWLGLLWRLVQWFGCRRPSKPRCYEPEGNP